MSMGERGMGAWGREHEIIESIPVMAYRATAAEPGLWRFTRVSGGLVERLEASEVELCADPGAWVLRIHPDDRERVVAERARACGNGRLETEYRLLRPGREDLWVHDIAICRDGTGRVLDGLVLDLTEHHNADRTLAGLHDARLASVTQLVRATTLRDTTLRLFVHDLRSPLSAVGGLARTLQERGDEIDAADRDRITERIVHAASRVADMVDDFVEYWDWDLTLDATRAPTSPVAFADLVPTVLAEVDVAPDRVEVDVDDDLRVDGTPELLRRVLVGLVRNALVHTPEDASVRLRAMHVDGRVVVAIEDDGPGIPEELRDRVFEPRVRLATPDGDGSRGTGTGLGVGLSLVRAAVDLLGGEIRVLEGVDGGAVFRVELPGTTDRSSPRSQAS